MVTSNINSNRISNNDEHLEANDYSNGAIQINCNFANLPANEILHHGINIQGIKKLDTNNYLPSKDQLMHVYGVDGSTIITTSSGSLPMLTPLALQTKYVEYVSEEQIITNDESEKSDCESINEMHKTPSKNVKRNLPHKKRIAKKLNSNQPYNHHHQEQYSIIMPSEETNLRNMQATNHHFDCTICGAVITEQLEFFMHLKNHYEPPMVHVKRKSIPDDENVNVIIEHRLHDDIVTAPENLIASLNDPKEEEMSQREQPLPDEFNDEFNEFSEPDDENMMEDLRKEVEKVVETIADNECLQEATWNYQVDETDVQQDDDDDEEEDLQLYSENLEDNYEEVELNAEATLENASMVNQESESRHYEHSEEEEDEELTLEQVRQSMRKTTRNEIETKVHVQEVDKEDIELTECLKKINNFKCNMCNKAFNSRTALGYHLKTHNTERRFVCDQCGKKFLTNGALKVHQRLHTDDRPYDCKFPGCGKCFRQWGDLKYHETSIHSDKKDHVCEFVS
jgi:hypothetical protein